MKPVPTANKKRGGLLREAASLVCFLLSAVLDMNICQMDKRQLLAGEIPSPINAPAGCGFCTRCPYATEQCRAQRPALREAAPGHFVACHLREIPDP